MSNAKMLAHIGKLTGVKAGSIIRKHATDIDAEPLKIGDGICQEAGGRGCFFIRIKRCEGNTGVIVDGDVEEFPSGTTGFVQRIACDAMARLDDTSELLMSMCSRSPGAACS